MKNQKTESNELSTTQLSLNFGGFYESLHSSLIDDALAMRFDVSSRDELSEEQETLIDDLVLQKSYSKLYLENFQIWLKENHALDVTLNFCKVWSPREYNFATNQIDYAIDDKDAAKCFVFFKKYFSENEDFRKYCEDLTTSCSGYWAFYKIEDLHENKDSKSVEFLLNFLAREANCDTSFIEDLAPLQNLSEIWHIKDVTSTEQ